MCGRYAPLPDSRGVRAWVGTCIDIDDQKLAEIQRDSLQALANSSAIGVALADLRGAILDANDHFLRMIGYDRSDIAEGKLRWDEITPPEWFAEDERALRELKESGIIKPYEKEYVHKSGGRVAVMVGVAAVGDSQAIAYFSDLTERRRSETNRRTSESRLKRLFESNVMGIVISNNEGSILEANDAFLQIVGYSRSDLEQGILDWRKLTPDEWLHLDELAIDQLAVDGVFSQYEKEYVRKDGSRVPISLGGARIAGTNDEQICYIIDLTEKRQAEEALRRSEARFRRLSDSNVIGIITARVDGAITEANDEFLRMIGYSREEFEAGDVRWDILTPHAFREADARAWEEMREFRRCTPYEKEYIRKDGTAVPFLIGGAMLEGSDDEAVCYLLDLSDHREAMLQIQESERRYRILAEALPQIVILTDEERRPIFTNRYFEQYTGARIDRRRRSLARTHSPRRYPRA